MSNNILSKANKISMLKVNVINCMSALLETASVFLIFCFINFLIFKEITPVFFKNFLSSLTNLNQNEFDILTLVTILTLIVSFAVKIVSGNYKFSQLNKLRSDVSSRLISKMIDLKYRKFITKEISYYKTLATWEVDNYIMSNVTPKIAIIEAVILVSFIFVLLLSQSLIPILVAGLIYSSTFLLFYFVTKNIFSKNGTSRIISNNNRLILVTSIFEDIKKIKVMNKLNERLKEYIFQVNIMSNNLAKIQYINFLNRPVIEFFTLILFIVYAFYAFSVSGKDENFLANLGFAILGGLKILPQLQTIVASASTIRTTDTNIEQISSFLNTSESSEAYTYSKYISKKLDDEVLLNCKNIRFKGGNRFIFDGFNFTLKNGQKWMIQGASGSGKTTLVEILLGLVDPKCGDIFYNGNTISNGDIYYLPQDAYFENKSINDFLHETKININELKKLLFPEFINEMNRFDAQIGENGSTLSGGQKQRLAILIALIENPKLLVLDESTSAIDKKLEIEISKYILNKFPGSVLWVNHGETLDGFDILKIGT